MLHKKSIIASLSGFQYGYNTSIIAAALLSLKEAFALTSLQQGWVVSTLLLGALLFSLVAGTLTDLIGRKKMLFIGGWLFLLGLGLCSLAPNYLVLLTGRFVLGMASSIALGVAPIYLIEMAPPAERGAVANLNQIGMAIGALCAYGLGYLLYSSVSWRLLIALGAVPAVGQLVGFLFLGKEEAATAIQTEKENSSWKELWGASFRPSLFIALMLVASQSLLGSSAVFYFTPLLFKDLASQDGSQGLLATFIIGIAYLVGILLSFWAVDRLGRRWLMLRSTLGMVVSLGVISCFFYFFPEQLPQIMIPSLLFFICCYAIGIGPIPPLMVGELTPPALRGRMMGLANFFGLLLNYGVTLTCPVLLERLALGGTFALYAVCGIALLAIFCKKLPETKALSIQPESEEK